MKRLRYTKLDNGSLSCTGVITRHDIVSVLIKKLSWQIIASTGEILREGTEPTDALVRKAIKASLKELGTYFDDEWRNNI